MMFGNIWYAWNNGIELKTRWKVTKTSSHPEAFQGKSVFKICSKFTGEHPCQSVISINFIEIKLRHGCSAIYLLHIFRTPFLRTTFGGCFCKYQKCCGK